MSNKQIDYVGLVTNSLLPILVESFKPTSSEEISTEQKVNENSREEVKKETSESDNQSTSHQTNNAQFKNGTFSFQSLGKTKPQELEKIWLPIDTGFIKGNVETQFYIVAELPGADKKDISITRTERTITITTIKGPPFIQYKKYLADSNNHEKRECSYGVIVREIRLPDDVLLEPAEKQYENGRLILKFNKIPAPESHKIEL